jgi:hypothetical protein
VSSATGAPSTIGRLRSGWRVSRCPVPLPISRISSPSSGTGVEEMCRLHFRRPWVMSARRSPRRCWEAGSPSAIGRAAVSRRCRSHESSFHRPDRGCEHEPATLRARTGSATPTTNPQSANPLRRHRCHRSHCHHRTPIPIAPPTMRHVAPDTPKREALTVSVRYT